MSYFLYLESNCKDRTYSENLKVSFSPKVPIQIFLIYSVQFAGNNPSLKFACQVGVPQLLQKLSSFNIRLLDKELTPVPVVKDLGVHLDACLSYNEHITKTVSNCLLKLKQINRIKHLLDRKTLLLVMNSFVFSKLLYCSTVWSNTSNSNIDKLQKVQNFAGRIILGLRKYDHISDGLRSLNWLPIKERLILNDATMMHKCINKLVPDYLVDMFKLRSQVHNRQTRSSSTLDIPLCRIKSLKCPRNFRRHFANVLLGLFILFYYFFYI